ncbi:uncharacterized protein LOC128892878 isoform X1 [Hylaeus anthracinus]|uniref:uncharacterized protein LOC128892878 isoform X1 n=1 Tax=Hylaeus anthracinus TaxID=313031 RepID=UPI0023B8BB50|nr:uncharacterized protein LOC128892878 isoform X1 [Hylaeus anthracinus]
MSYYFIVLHRSFFQSTCGTSSLCDGLEDNNIKQVTTLLLNKEADPNTLIPTHGVTPFHLVIGNDSEAFAEEVTKLFLRHGGNPNVRSVDGLTPVHVAAAWGRVTVLELLLANGGDPLCLDDEGRSPFHYAFDGKYYKAIVVLGKYCENIRNEDKATKQKVTFDKLLINNGDVIAEYALLHTSDMANEDTLNENELKKNEEERLPDNRYEYSFNNDDNDLHSRKQSNTNLAELRIREEMDKEKCLLNEIINQLSSSLKSSSKDQEISNEHVQYKQNDTSPLSILNADNSTIHDMKDNFSLKTRMRKRTLTPRYKRKIFEQNNARIPLIPAYDPNDSIISKSPNCLIEKSSEREGRYLSPNIINKESKFRAVTPCMTRTKSFQSEFNYGKEMARSTPRRKKRFYRQYSSLRKFKRNDELASSENTSPDSSNSLSPDQNRPYKLNYKFNNHVAIKLHENKYDDDAPTNSHLIENKNGIEKYEVKENLTNLCNNNLENIKLENVDCIEKNKEDSKEDDILQKEIMEELKSNNSLHSCKEYFSTCYSSFKSQSYTSVQEEYKHEYPDDGINFLERRIYTLPRCKPVDDCDTADKLWPQSLNVTTDVSIENEVIRKQLIDLGDNPGPITNTTKQLYLKRLTYLKSRTCNQLSSKPIHSRSPSKVSYSKCDLNPFLIYGDWVNYLEKYRITEKNVFKEFFVVNPSRKWREGISKTCFNYLLLDPRITKDLPSRAKSMTNSAVWSTFLSSIFYVGKGTRNRPYFHLKDAFDAWVSNRRSENTKIQSILNIWNAGYGVICLHIYQNTIPVEAYTREAAMIDALGVNKLTNCKHGDYYGIAATWNIIEKCNFGRYLLYRAMHIYLHEGERQIFPDNM